MYFYGDPKITYKFQVSFHVKLSLHYHCVAVLSELKHSMKVLQPGRHQKLIKLTRLMSLPHPHFKLYKREKILRGAAACNWAGTLVIAFRELSLTLGKTVTARESPVFFQEHRY